MPIEGVVDNANHSWPSGSRQESAAKMTFFAVLFIML